MRSVWRRNEGRRSHAVGEDSEGRGRTRRGRVVSATEKEHFLRTPVATGIEIE